MEEAAKFPWAQVLASFLWIFGLAIVLATLSWHEFQVRVRSGKWGKVIKRSGFRKGIYFGFIFIMAGIAFSVHSILVSLLGGLMAVGFLILLIREYWQCEPTSEI